MKKIFYLASIAALAFSSCAKDETTGVEIQNVGGSKIVAAVEADDTRTELIKGEAGYEFRWKATDALYVYGDEKHPLPGETFAISEGAESASAVFSGVALKSNAKYVATYPAKTSVKPTWDKLGNGTTVPFYYEVAPASVKMSIPAEQNYKPGSFDTGVAPAVSTTFAVDAEGNAAVKMQPVADYLFVNIVGTAPISKLTLELWDGNSNHNKLAIAGEAVLTKYAYNQTTRYYLSNTGMTGNSIVLNAEATPEVDCHEANTYVFTIPAGILGMNNNVEAVIYVNDSETFNFGVMDEGSLNPVKPVDGQERIINTHLNYKTKKVNGVDTPYGRTGKDSKNNTVYNLPMENTVFWLNSKEDGEIVPFIYNPSDAVIITDQIELLDYMENYDNSSRKDVYSKSAFICNDAEFDFSKEALDALATEYRNNPKYTYVNDLINNYYAFGFPCITKFEDTFAGNGAVISNVAKLRSMDGIFGEIDGTISGVTFENIISAKDVEVVNEGKKNEYEVTTYGVILGTDENTTAATIKNVVVSGGSGEAVMAEGSSANYAGITFENVSEDLNHIFGNVNVAAATTTVPAFDLSATWDEVSNVAGSVFETVTPAGRAIINITNEEATYAALTDMVVNGTYPNVASVVINGVSFWTGGEAAPAANYKVNNAIKGKYIQYAEELAYGLTTGVAVLYRNIDLNFENLQWYDEDGDLIGAIPWTTAKFDTLNGAGNTVKGIVMFDEGATAANHSVAPFELNAAQNIILDGVEIYLVSEQGGTNIPQWIAGLSISASEITGVTINDLKIVAGDADEQNAPQYSTSWKVKMGYLVADATDIKVSNSAINGVYSNVKGLAAPVAKLTLTSKNAQMLNNTLTNVELDGGQTEITENVEYVAAKHWNMAGETFGHVFAAKGQNAVGIKFDGYSNIAFTYNAQSPIVIYDLDSTGDNVVLENE